MNVFIVPVKNYIDRNLLGGWSIGKLARHCGLNFTAFERFGKRIIGWDSLRNELLVLRQMDERICYCIINLKQVESCTVFKEYRNIEAVDWKIKGLDHSLEKVSLHLRLKNFGRSIALPFYERSADPIGDIPYREGRARRWMQLISGIMTLSLPGEVPQLVALPG
ncbi:hypothetical protein V9K67_04535 [Paraflavisolibacter sp. H34]|uniref:hypothetical protein n=1 Tax=Huijunlia imazamoxiresistens TaxID=3127457 RepID=UPI00301629DA